MFNGPWIILIVEERETNLMSLALLFIYLMLNMFRMLIHPSSGACDLCAELFHRFYWSGSTCVGVTLWYGTNRVAGWNTASTCNTVTTPTQPYRNSNTHRTKNNRTNMVTQQNSRKFLMMDILMSETCWAYKKWNKIASDIKLIFILQLAKKLFHFILLGLKIQLISPCDIDKIRNNRPYDLLENPLI